ncbi:MAG: MFS transporter [Anaerocolumna sp.]
MQLCGTLILKTQSGLMIALSIVFGFVPTFFLSPFAGVWADRFNRKRLIMLSDGLIAITTLILAILFSKGYEDIWLLFVASSIRAVGSAVQAPAINAFVPNLVPEEKLTKVNGINGSIQSLVMLISPMISGILLDQANLVTIFLIDIVTATLAISILLLFLHVPTHGKALEEHNIGYFSDLVKGIRYINENGFIRTLFIHCGFYFLLVAPLAFLTPLQVTRTFGEAVWRLTAIEVTFSIGMMVGGILIATWGGFRNKLYSMVLSTVIMGVGTIALGIIPVFWIYLLFMGIVGFGMPLFNTPFTVLLQQKVKEDYMGRVFGVFGMLSSSIMPLAMLVYGPLADLIKIEWILVVTGILILIQCFFMVRNKTLQEVG